MPRTLTSILTVIILNVLFSCGDAPEGDSAPGRVIDYAAFDKKVAGIRAFYKAHAAEDIATLSELLSDTLKWCPADNNGNSWLGKEDYLKSLQNWHDTFEDIEFIEGIHIPGKQGIGYWSGSIFPEEAAHYSPVTIRAYGTWTALHAVSGKKVGTKFFSMITFNTAGKISQVSDYFDMGNLLPQQNYTEK